MTVARYPPLEGGLEVHKIDLRIWWRFSEDLNTLEMVLEWRVLLIRRGLTSRSGRYIEFGLLKGGIVFGLSMKIIKEHLRHVALKSGQIAVAVA
jgi:hypothetical protein